MQACDCMAMNAGLALMARLPIADSCYFTAILNLSNHQLQIVSKLGMQLPTSELSIQRHLSKALICVKHHHQHKEVGIKTPTKRHKQAKQYMLKCS